MFKIGKKGIDLIKKFEGLELTAYFDPVKIPTIGYGHIETVSKEDVINKKTITEKEAEQLLKYDLKKFEKGVNELINQELTNQNEFDAMCCLAFNIGLANFKKSSVLRNHNNNRKIEASRSFNLFNKARKNGQLIELKGLVIRRSAEANLYLLVDYNNNFIKTSFNDDNNNDYDFIEEERNLGKSEINKNAVAGGLTTVAIASSQINEIANNTKGNLDYFLIIGCILILGFFGFIIYERFKQRKDGWS